MNDIIDLLNKNTINIIMLLSKGDFYVREISGILKISPSAVHSAIKVLLEFNFVKEVKQKNKKIYALNRDNVLLRKVKSFLNFNQIVKSKAYKELNQTGAVGLYGSFAQGANDEHSDLDLWVYGEKIDSALVSKISAKFEKEFKTETKVLILNKKKLENLKDNDPEFFNRLKYTSVTEGEVFFD